MNISTNVKKVIITLGVLIILVLGFFVHALAGIGSSPVQYAEPPAFVEQYAAQLSPPGSLVKSNANSNEYEIIDGRVQQSTPTNWSKDYYNEAALVRNAFLEGESLDTLFELFSHPDKETRVKAASAFAEVNIKLSHDEASDFDEKRKQFWLEAKEHSANMQNAIFEALIVSAQERTRSYIPYTLAWWMHENNQRPKAVEMLAWAGKHHPDPWVRRFAVFYVVERGGNEELAADLITDRANDPDYKVRNEVLKQRSRRLKEMVFGKKGE